jgi:hypothetical protein
VSVRGARPVLYLGGQGNGGQCALGFTVHRARRPCVTVALHRTEDSGPRRAFGTSRTASMSPRDADLRDPWRLAPLRYAGDAPDWCVHDRLTDGHTARRICRTPRVPAGQTARAPSGLT